MGGVKKWGPKQNRSFTWKNPLTYLKRSGSFALHELTLTYLKFVYGIYTMIAEFKF